LHHARIVELARDYIDANLAHPIHIDNLARASMAARATLYRAFRACLDESPQSYVLKLRLNRIRQALADPTEAARTVATVSNRWGISELGRLAASYREQFDEQTC
jgi:transcriptional regulator GlxA family with amidase domain